MLEMEKRFVYFSGKQTEEALKDLAHFDIVEFFAKDHCAIVKGYQTMFENLRDISNFRLGMPVK